ncbi:hypothetical protein TNCV_4794561 [Trichonephila clavipes]|nr:hypothetical protein TNCV_4794561 [Trichonephila clavipes]
MQIFVEYVNLQHSHSVAEKGWVVGSLVVKASDSRPEDLDDNPRPHRSQLVDGYLESKDIYLMDWTARSPELNPLNIHLLTANSQAVTPTCLGGPAVDRDRLNFHPGFKTSLRREVNCISPSFPQAIAEINITLLRKKLSFVNSSRESRLRALGWRVMSSSQVLLKTRNVEGANRR